MPPFLVTLVCLALFATHAWIALGHRQKMGTEATDKPQDPLYTETAKYAAFGSLMLYQAFLLWRRLSLNYQSWYATSPLGRGLDFLPLPSGDFFLLLGCGIFLGGLVLRIWSIRILGRLFTFEIGIREGHKIIEEGPYRYIRHPSYTGYLLLVIGIAVAYASLSAMLAMSTGIITFLVLRMNHEEKMLARHFGADYESYMKRTKRLIPYVY